MEAVKVTGRQGAPNTTQTLWSSLQEIAAIHGGRVFYFSCFLINLDASRNHAMAVFEPLALRFAAGLKGSTLSNK
jgi:hypothetical protein